MGMIEDQEEFMLRGKQSVSFFNDKQAWLYKSLVDEEYNEFYQSRINREATEYQVKEAIDIMVVTIGWLFSVGVDPARAWKIVWENNMLKLSSKMEKDDNGKIKKSDASKQRKAQMMLELKELLNEAE